MLYAAGPFRWGTVEKLICDHISVKAWSPEDMLEVLQAHTQHHSHVKGTFLCIDMTTYTELWGVPEASSWSQQAWVSLPQVIQHLEKAGLSIDLSNSVPLTGLLAILTRTHLPTLCAVIVTGGTADLHTVEEWVDRLNEEEVMTTFEKTTIVVPPGVEADTMRATKMKFKDMPTIEWVTETGEPYHFDSDEEE